jgi:hypothetical protein
MLAGTAPASSGTQCAHVSDMAVQVKPSKPIRRFDVFAEYRKLDAQADGKPVDQAKGYGLWVAKVVASRKFRRQKTAQQSSDEAPRRRRKWHVLSGTPQTDKLFDHEIVERMGANFYREMFAPAIREARSGGKTYESIRDRLRRRWKPDPEPDADRTAPRPNA